MKRLLMNFAVSASFVAALMIVQGCGSQKHPAKPGGVQQLPEETIEVQVLDDNTGKPASKVTVGTKKGTAGTKVTTKTPPPPPAIDIQSVIGTTPYTIQKNDTLSTIGVRYGIRWQDIVAINPGINPSRLRVGQVIQLPGVHNVPATKVTGGKAGTTATVKPVTPAKTTAPVTKAATTAAATPATAGVYVVQKGDVFGTIAEKHGVKRADLRAVNPQIKDENKIRAGQKLNLPANAKNVASTKDVKPAKAGAAATKAVAVKKEKKATTPATVTPPAVVEKKAEVQPAVEPATPPVKQDTPEVKVQQTTKTADAPALSPTPAPTPVQNQDYETYTVKEGEDVYAVAIRWGVSPSELKSVNNLTGNELKPNQVLRIPKGN